MFFKAIVSFLILFVTIAHAQELIPGLIPRFYSIEAASDLPMSAEEAHEDAIKGKDLSLIEPDSSTNIWRPERNKIPDTVLLGSHQKVKFIKSLPSRSGQIRFTVVTKTGNELNLIFSKKMHNFLLRRNILSKLGFATQPMSWVDQVDIEFQNTIDKDLFKEEMKDKLLAGVDRWITEEKDLTITLQDGLAIAPETNIYNLALGLMPESVHQGRRVLRSAYVPIALVDTPESVNLFPWSAGRVVLNQIKLNHTQDIDLTYGTSWEDARWVGRRLAKLDRRDFSEIVKSANYPEAVEKVLIEKIISRRNDLIRLLQLEQEYASLEFFPEISLRDELKDGEIVKEFFQGFTSRFSYGDPESPFSASEIGSFILSRVQGQLIETSIERLNKLLGTNDQSMYSDAIKKIVNNDGPFYPTQALVVPMFHGNLIFSRDIVTGTYMGTNNKVQLVDNFGFALDAGYLAGVEGAEMQIGIKGAASVAIQRVFSHVKPVQSLKKSLKEPYKNMLVPFLLKGIGHRIDSITTAKSEEQAGIIQSIVGDLKSALAVGESFIITDSINPSLFLEGSFSISQFYLLPPNILKAYAKIQAQKMIISRFHLHRPSEHVFQIYQDSGHGLKLMVTMKLKSYVPLISFNARWNKPKAEIQFFPVSLHPKDVSVELLKALRISILSLNNDALRDVLNPHRIEHDAQEKGNTWQFLIFKRNRVGSDQMITLSHAKGGEKKVIQRRYDAFTTGVDSESYATESINNLISMLSKSNISLSQVPTVNPGFTVAGKARNKVFTSEFDGSRMTTNFQRIFNGWKVKTNKLKDFIEIINQEAGEFVFDPLAIMNTDSILLYQLQFNYCLTQEGVDSILNVSQQRLQDLIFRFAVGHHDEGELIELTEVYLNELKIIKRSIYQDSSAVMKRYHQWLRDFQDLVTIRGLKELAGKENIAYQGRIDGFRQGDEYGDTPIFSHVFGELPLPLQVSPTQNIMQSWGILEGELLLNWMLERAL